MVAADHRAAAGDIVSYRTVNNRVNFDFLLLM